MFLITTEYRGGLRGGGGGGGGPEHAAGPTCDVRDGTERLSVRLTTSPPLYNMAHALVSWLKTLSHTPNPTHRAWLEKIKNKMESL